MIIGNGLLANALINADSEKLLIFASGVSNSLEVREAEFSRELNLLKKSLSENPEKKLIYFSTCSIFDFSKKQAPYVLHKLNVEKYIIENVKNYLILRIGNAIGNGGNPNTLFNFLKNKIENEEQFTVHQKAKRILIDVDDVSNFVKSNGEKLENITINLAYPYQYTLLEIISSIESTLNKKADYLSVDTGDFYHLEFSEDIINFFIEVNPSQYLKNLSTKYLNAK